jgi:hypothetical protein
VAAFKTWRESAVQVIRAVGGSKGVRFDKNKMDIAIQNLPTLTDTLGTAQQKVNDINLMLENAEQSILVRDRSVKPPPPTTTGTPPPVNPRAKIYD